MAERSLPFGFANSPALHGKPSQTGAEREQSADGGREAKSYLSECEIGEGHHESQHGTSDDNQAGRVLGVVGAFRRVLGVRTSVDGMARDAPP
ncbi:hypothetical protein A4G29_00115 [Mycobacterium kansasii]|nr:hypothetical protein A4G29_00115 [Mycobacterium kansasii]